MKILLFVLVAGVSVPALAAGTEEAIRPTISVGNQVGHDQVKDRKKRINKKRKRRCSKWAKKCYAG